MYSDRQPESQSASERSKTQKVSNWMIWVPHILISASIATGRSYLAYSQDGDFLVKAVNFYAGSVILISIIKHRMELLLNIGKNFRARLKYGQDIPISLT